MRLQTVKQTAKTTNRPNAIPPIQRTADGRKPAKVDSPGHMVAEETAEEEEVGSFRGGKVGPEGTGWASTTCATADAEEEAPLCEELVPKISEGLLEGRTEEDGSMTSRSSSSSRINSSTGTE